MKEKNLIACCITFNFELRAARRRRREKQRRGSGGVVAATQLEE